MGIDRAFPEDTVDETEKYSVRQVETAKSEYANYLAVKNTDVSQKELDILYPPKQVAEYKKLLEVVVAVNVEANREILNGSRCVKKWFT